jgi:hypothetical protein
MGFKTGASSNGSLLSIETKPGNAEMIDHVSSFLCMVHSYIISIMLSLVYLVFSIEPTEKLHLLRHANFNYKKNMTSPYSNENHNPVVCKSLYYF